MKCLLIHKVAAAADFFRTTGSDNSLYGRHKIDCVNWREYPYCPEVYFSIAHTQSSICLKFFVEEKYTRANVTENNGRVCTDSCVEFFIAFNDSGYYNLEHNCIGTPLLKYRTGQHNVELAGIEVLQRIIRHPSLGREPFGERCVGQWELELEIPSAVFFRDNITDFSGIEARGNFYKCGDELTLPHYLSWNPITNATPNFHLPEYFGRLVFEN